MVSLWRSKQKWLIHCCLYLTKSRTQDVKSCTLYTHYTLKKTNVNTILAATTLPPKPNRKNKLVVYKRIFWDTWLHQYLKQHFLLTHG